jgi:hypothetical protein
LDVKTVRVNRWVKEHVWDARLGMVQNASRGIPPFNFSDWPEIGHRGLPEVGVYEWTEFVPGDKCEVVVRDGDDEGCAEVSGCGFCVYQQKCWTGSRDGPDLWIGKKCEDGWEFPEPLEPWVVPVTIVVSSLSGLFVVTTFAAHFLRAHRRAHGFTLL